jgi:hypothetical protein
MPAIWPTGPRCSPCMEILGAFTVVLTAMVKFLFAGLRFVRHGARVRTSRSSTRPLADLSGMVLFYLTRARQLLEWFRKRYVKRLNGAHRKGLAPKPIFTRTNRLDRPGQAPLWHHRARHLRTTHLVHSHHGRARREILPARQAHTALVDWHRCWSGPCVLSTWRGAFIR